MKLPSYNLPAILKLKQRLEEELTLHYFACVPKGDEFEELITFLHELMPKVHKPTLQESLRHTAGYELNEARISELAWRLAGNQQRLTGEIVTPPWSRQFGREWVPMEILHVSPMTVVTKATNGAVSSGRVNTLKGTVERHGGQCAFQILAGTPAGKKLQKFWSNAYAHATKVEFGFSRFDLERLRGERVNGNYPLRNILELAKMRFFALMDPAANTANLAFTDVKGSVTTTAWNRSLLKMRQRIGYTCPRRYPLEVMACHRCPAGYSECQAACHEHPYVKGNCSVCQRANRWLDSTVQPETCVDCVARQY